MGAAFKYNYIKTGLKLSYYRKIKSLTQQQLAEKTGLSQKHLHQKKFNVSVFVELLPFFYKI